MSAILVVVSTWRKPSTEYNCKFTTGYLSEHMFWLLLQTDGGKYHKMEYLVYTAEYELMRVLDVFWPTVR